MNPIQLNTETPEFGITNVTLNNVLGKGAFGTVYNGCISSKNSLKNNIQCAVKTMNKQMDRIIKNELNILRRTSNAFIVNSLTNFDIDQKSYIVLEYLHFDLTAALNIVGFFNELEAAFYIKEIILGLEYLHSENIIYKDLKDSNILLDEKGHVKLSNFGISENRIEGKLNYKFGGTLKYMAPEVIQESGHGVEVDWWSLGVLFYYMISRDYPFPQKDKKIILENARKEKFHLPKHASVNAKDLIKNLLKFSRKKRLGYTGALAVKQHIFFRDTNWEKVATCQEVPPFVPEQLNVNLKSPKYHSNKIFNHKVQFIVWALFYCLILLIYSRQSILQKIEFIQNETSK